MIRLTTLLWVALLVVAGGTVMRVSLQVRQVQGHLSNLSRDIQREQDSIRILTAEWHTLNDPQRIDALAKRHLQLVSTPIQRVVSLADIPLKPSPEQAMMMAAAAARKAGKPAISTTKGPVVAVKSTEPVPAAPRDTVRAAFAASGAPSQSLVLVRAGRNE